MANVNPLLQDDDAPPPGDAGVVGNPLLAQEEPPPPRAPEGPVSWGDVPAKALSNLPGSALNFGKAMLSPVLHPVQTYEAVKDLGSGALSKAGGLLGVQQNPDEKATREKTLDALIQHYKDTYGSEEGIKKALQNDPVGVMADASMLVTGGGSALARAPGMLGKVGELTAAAGRTINPVNVALSAARPVTEAAAKGLAYPLSLKSGAPLDSLHAAVDAGKTGSTAFVDQLRGRVEPSAIVDAAHDAVSQLAQKRRDDYLSSKAGWAANNTPVDYSKINQALTNAQKDVMHGNQVYRPAAKEMLDAMSDVIMDWQTTPNAGGINYHGIEGVDKLKQKIGDIRSMSKPGTPEEAMGARIYNAIKNTLTEHDPNYQTAMGQYGEASDLLKQLKNTMSLNPKAATDTTLRKLLLGQKQVDGNKASLLSELKEINPEIGNMIAGHILHSALPVGLKGGVGAALSMSGHGASVLGGFAGVDPVSIAANIASSSPRLAGEALYGAGKLASGAKLPTSMLAPQLLRPVEKPVLDDGPSGPYFGPPGERPKYGDIPRDKEYKSPFFPGARPGRKSGGRISRAMTPEALIAMAERIKNNLNKTTEPLLQKPDEHIVHALSVASAALEK